MRLSPAIAAVATALLLAAAPAAQGEYRGRLEIRHSDDFAGKRTQTKYRLVGRGRSIPLVLARAPRVPSGSAVRVRGRRVGSAIRGTVRAHGLARAASVAAGPRKTAVLLFNFTTDTRQPWTPSFVRQRVFTATNSVNAYYVEESYGDVSLEGNDRTDGDVLGWYTINSSTSGCNVDQWAQKARTAAAADGFHFGDYEHVIYAFPSQASCAWAGLGELPGEQSWLNGTISTRVVAHELGHNMGLHHASSLSCTAGGAEVAISSSCTPDEYGDPFDVMGSVLRHSNAWHLRQIGFMESGNVKVATASGTYTITSAIARGPGTQLLRVPRGGTSPAQYYDLELRTSGGVFDDFLSTDPAVQGVTIHMDPDTSVITQSMLLDTTPGSDSGFYDAPLAAGRVFTDGVVSISVSSVDADTATVEVTGLPDATPPSAPDPVTAEPSEDRVTLSWPPSSDAVGVAGYRVYRGAELLTTTTDTTYADTLVEPGTTYSYRVVAFDAAGNQASSATVTATVPGTPQAAATEPAPGSSPQSSTPPPAPPLTDPDPPLPPPDTTRPSVLIASPAHHAHIGRRSVVRASAFDAVGVARIDVWVDGVLRKSVRASRVAWRWPLRSARRGRHLVIVRAYDAAGNLGFSSVRVRVSR